MNPLPSNSTVAPAPPCVVPSDQASWFTQEVHPHDAQLKAWLRGNFRLRDIDDVVQESYLRIWKAKSVQHIHSAKAFLYMVARRLALDTLRKHGNAPVDSVGDLAVSRVIDNSPDAAETLITKETLRHLADAIAALPDRCREVVILHKLKGLTHKEVAARLNVPVRTVEKRGYQGLKACEAYLQTRGINGFFD